jgi:hypothetical protein
MVKYHIYSGEESMEICDVCEKDLTHGYQNVSLYSAHLIRKGVSKGKLGTTVASEYSKFSPVMVKVCKRHRRGFWIQRIMPGVIVFLVVMLPIMTLLSLIPVWTDANRIYSWLVGFVLSMVIVYFLVRRITYDGYVASLMTVQIKNREQKVEFFSQAKYRRIMRNLNRLDSMIPKN